MKKVWIGIVSLLLGGCALDAQTDGVSSADDESQGATGGVEQAVEPSSVLRMQKPVLIGPGSTLSYPTSKVLDTSETKYIIEPEGGTKKDDAGNTYTDNNYWNMCGPGAAAVVLYYSPWRNNPKYGTINTHYKEPYGPHVSNTLWTSPSNDKTYGYKTIWRPSIMYLAEYSNPPTFSRAGLDNFSSYPTTGSSTSDACNVLNWEASDHASKSSYCGSGSYFYAEASGSSSFHSHVVTDINATNAGQTGWALWLAVNTYVDSSHHLPNWSRSLTHAIAVVGYNDVAGTYTYVDTCGTHCNGSSGNQQSTRVFTVSQSVMHSIMINHIW